MLGVSAPNPCIVQESTVFPNQYSTNKIMWEERETHRSKRRKRKWEEYKPQNMVKIYLNIPVIGPL